MRSLIKLTSLLITCILFFSCGNDFEYKYNLKPDFYNCEHKHSDLLKEALHTFEKDITNYHGKYNSDPIVVYSTFIIRGVKGTAKYHRLVTPHTLKVFEALKEIDDLWNTNDKNSNLNYNSEIVSCIAENIKDEDLKKTFKSLISVNGMSPSLFGSALIPKYQELITDRNLALYAALDLYFARLFDADLSSNQKRGKSKTMQKNVKDHSEHNH